MPEALGEKVELHFEDGLTIARRIHSGEMTSVAVTESMLSRIGKLGAFVRATESLALQQAEAADREIGQGNIRLPLHGVPIAVKDLLGTQDIVTTYGMPLNNNNVPTKDATAAGLCFASIGSDTGGSIRFPSAANEIVGLKPTWGRVSRSGVFPLAYSLDHLGPMTRSVADAAAMLEIIAGYDHDDPTSSSKPVPKYLEAMDDGVEGLRIGVDSNYVGGGTNSELVDAVNEVSSCLKSLGCEIVDIKIPFESMCNGWPITTAVEALHAHRDTYPEQKARYGP